MRLAVLVVLGCGLLACGASEAVPSAPTDRETPPTIEPTPTPATALAEDVGCNTPWYLDPARGEGTLTCRTPMGDEVSTDCEACAPRPDGDCFADLPGEIVERRARDGTHHAFPASHICQPACCLRDALTPLPAQP